MIELGSDELLTVAQVAELLYVSKSAVYRLIEEDATFPVIRIGGSWRIVKEELKKWINGK